MNLESDKRLNIQLRLDFSSAPTGEARQAGGEDIESLSVTNEPERPADTRQSCQRNFSNRRVRTRTHGGVGGAEPRGSPLSRSLARCRCHGRRPWRPVTEVLRARRLPLVAGAIFINESTAQRLCALASGVEASSSMAVAELGGRN